MRSAFALRIISGISFLLEIQKSLRAFLCCFFTRGGVTSKCIKEHKCSLPVLPHSVKMCLERSAERNKHKNIKIIFR